MLDIDLLKPRIVDDFRCHRYHNIYKLVDLECLAYSKDKIKVYVVPLNKLELGFWYLAPSPAVPVDGVMWEMSHAKRSGGESPHAQRHGLC